MTGRRRTDVHCSYICMLTYFFANSRLRIASPAMPSEGDMQTDRRLSTAVLDTDLAHAAANALLATSDVPDETIEACVHDGWVWLIGSAEAPAQRAAAERAVANLPGVKGVTNLVRLKAPASTP